MTSWRVIALLLLPGCAGGPPARFVLEHDVGDWRYRVYQHVLDVEIAVEGNAADGHTATYVRRVNPHSRQVPFANVFVSVYEHPAGLAAEVRRQVMALASYESEVRDLGGGRVWYLDAGPGDRWALWVSGRYVVKIGVSEAMDEVPQDIVSTYMGIYPSDLDEHGRARQGTASAGDSQQEAPASDNPNEVPSFLHDNAPR